MNVKELRKAYVTLGLDEHATLTQARDAYLTWVCLLDHDRTPIVFADPEARPDLLHHELDLAWHAIEQAHQHGVMFPRQARGCRRCGGTPAVQVTLHSVQPGGFRARTSTSSERLCRDCGLEAGWRTQRANLQRGWWGVLAPFANLQAIGRNSTELAFLRRLEPADRRRPRAGGRPAAATRLRWYQRRDISDRRGFALLTALAVIVVLFGVVLPVGSGSGGPTTPTAASTSATTAAPATTGTSAGATTPK
jgi:hypothetical protein